MTDSKLEHDNFGEKTELRHSTFSCAACGSGTEKFSKLFNNGTCNHCGNPASVVVETSHPEDIKRIQESVVVLYSKNDEKIANSIMAEMRDSGISVIDPKLIAENEKAGNKANTLSYLADESKYVMVIPAPGGQLSDDRLIAASVEGVFAGNRNKVVPLYPDNTYRGRSLMLEDRMGVNWTNESDRRGMDKNRFINFMKKNS